jgi:signal transduction histidine kinase
MNLIANAIDAIEESFTKLEFLPGDYVGIIKIFTELNLETNNIIIKIQDNGLGMSEETKEKIFNKFFTTKAVGKGTGLGLSIVHQILEKHQGVLQVNSTLGEGSKFIISIPTHIKM